MKFLFLDTYYPAFLRKLYSSSSGLENYDYTQQLQQLAAQCFGTSDFYSTNVRALGHETWDVIANSLPLQKRWAYENDRGLMYSCPAESNVGQMRIWQHSVVASQIEQLKPDVLYVQNMKWTDGNFLRLLRPHVRLIVGQTAYPLSSEIDLGAYDLIFTSFPHYVDQFHRMGIASEYLRIAFEPRILNQVLPTLPRGGVAFVGSYSPDHVRGTVLLEEVARQCPVEFWGQGIESLLPNSLIRRSYRGEAWGLEMYRVLASSRIALNRHIEVAGRFANNMRLYEATGVGTLLITDAKENLYKLFDIDREIVTYSTAQECAEKVRYYLEHSVEADAIARAGQERTLHEHTYAKRMEEMVAIAHKYLRVSAATPKGLVSLWSNDYFKQTWQRRSRTFLKRVKNLPGIRRVKWEWERRQPQMNRPRKVSFGYVPLSEGQVAPSLESGWRDSRIPNEQRNLVDLDLQRMYFGYPSKSYRAAAEAIIRTQLIAPSIFEVGCASGYYSEALPHLLGHSINYIGADYSEALLLQGRTIYPITSFMVADASALSVASSSCDVLFSATVLLHVKNYEMVIAESARVSRDWCVFHRTPVVSQASTLAFSKFAYGVPTLEYVFNEQELFSLFSKYRLEVIEKFYIEDYGLPSLDEPVRLMTYLTRKML